MSTNVNFTSQSNDMEPTTSNDHSPQEASSSSSPTNLRDIFRLIAQNSLPEGLASLARAGGRHFTVITLCSGTDAPILSIRAIQEACLALGYERVLSAEHVCSVEIEPVKQAFIRRNIRPVGHIFRDVNEFAQNDFA